MLQLWIGLLGWVLSANASTQGVDHPLTPLTQPELDVAAGIVRSAKEFPKGALFPMIALKEPPKAEVLKHKPGTEFRREAFAIVLDRANNKTFEAVVDLRTQKTTSFKEIPGAQPLVLVEEYDTVPKIVKADARWQEAIRKRGIQDFEEVFVDTWAPHFIPSAKKGRRILRAVSYHKKGVVNFYGRPIEGVIAIVDLNDQKVVEVIDTGVVPISQKTQDLDEASIGATRKDLKPLVATQPEGASYAVQGNLVRWQNWSFRFALHPREGLVVYNVAYDHQGKTRPILYRGSLSETVVPYGDPDKNWSWRNAFDEGEYGLGRLASPLDRGQDVPANAQLFDVPFTDDFGKSYILKSVVGLYERDGGLMWKHYDIFANRNQARRVRDLVLTSVATIGNYDYAFYWIFHQDGSIDVDVGSTGIMLPKGVKEEKIDHAHSGSHAHSHLVAKNVAAPHHQHFFNFRLDLDIDNEKNTAVEMNSRAMPKGPKNPYLNGILMEDRVLGKESVAQRDLSLKDSRKWRIANTNVKTGLGYEASFILVPGENTVPYSWPDSLVRQRAKFIEHHFWVTRYHEDEVHAGGYYPNQSAIGDGLGKWASDNEDLRNQDLVVWYTLGMTHIPRPEEWPVMPVHHTSFKLIPAGFFEKNPSLDLPR